MTTQPELKKVHVNGIDLHYLDEGSGDPVVLVHGGGATDYRSWLPIIDPLNKRYHVNVPSLRYHYPNEWIGDGSDYSAQTHADDVAALIAALDLAPAYVIGHSLGATTALVLTRQHPELVRSLVLEEPGLAHWLGETMPETAPTEDMIKAVEHIRQVAAKGDVEQAARLYADMIMGPGALDHLPDAVRQRMIDNLRLVMHPDSASMVRTAELVFSREDARAIKTPTLLLRGDSSQRWMLLANDELAKEMPEAERVLIPHASHLLHGMNPQAFSEAVLAFLARH